MFVFHEISFLDLFEGGSFPLWFRSLPFLGNVTGLMAAVPFPVLVTEWAKTSQVATDAMGIRYRILLLFTGSKGLPIFTAFFNTLAQKHLKTSSEGTDQEVDLAAGEGPGTGFHNRQAAGRIEDLAGIEIDDFGPNRLSSSGGRTTLTSELPS